MLMPLFGDALARLQTWSLADFLIAIVIIAACVALVVIALRQFQITIPEWLVRVFWVVVAAFVIILAIRIVSSL